MLTAHFWVYIYIISSMGWRKWARQMWLPPSKLGQHSTCCSSVSPEIQCLAFVGEEGQIWHKCEENAKCSHSEF